MIIPINNVFRAKVNENIENEWAGPLVATRGVLYDTSNLDGFISATDNELTGYILYHIQDARCEILVLQSLNENHGIGTALINAVTNMAREHNCTCVWLVTTNDNIHAIRFYQRLGFELSAVHINALDESRKLKPAIPLLGNENIPLKHEFEFNYAL